MGLGQLSKLNFLVLDGFESGLQTQGQAEENINLDTNLQWIFI